MSISHKKARNDIEKAIFDIDIRGINCKIKPRDAHLMSLGVRKTIKLGKGRPQENE